MSKPRIQVYGRFEAQEDAEQVLSQSEQRFQNTHEVHSASVSEGSAELGEEGWLLRLDVRYDSENARNALGGFIRGLAESAESRGLLELRVVEHDCGHDEPNPGPCTERELVRWEADL